MKPTSSKLSWAFISSFILLAGSSLADSPGKPPAAEDLVGVHVGYASDYDFYRLDLRSDFTGFCAHVSPPRSILHGYGVHTYRITHWNLKGWELSFTVVPAEAKGEPIYLKGRAEAFDVLRLEVGGTTNNWSRKVVLYSEEQTRVSDEETKTAIKRVEAK